jgi:choline dehydrogenase-like flavoprotein
MGLLAPAHPGDLLPRIEKTQVAVVGAGVAGCLVAYRLAEAGRDVVVLEAGPRVDRAAAVQAFRRDPYRGISSPYPEHPLAPRPLLEDLEHHYLQSGPELFMGLYERRVGGSTWHWLGTAMRFLEEDFRMRSQHGVADDWPISLEQLAPYYAAAEQELGVAGPAPAPLPPHPLSKVDQAVAEACQVLGLSTEALPQARNSRPHRGRPACCGSANCVPICPVGAKYDASLHAELAERAGARVWSGTPVTGLRGDSAGRIQELLYRAGDGQTYTLEAETFVLACHGIETPRLLLASGLANSGGAVGRYLMGGTAAISWGLAVEPVDPRNGPQASMGLFGQRGGPHRAERSGFLTSVASDGWPHGNPEALLPELLAQGLRGAELRRRMTEHLARQVCLVSTCEELPDRANAISCDTGRPDLLGVGRPRIAYRIGDYTRRGLPIAQELHGGILKEMGAKEVGHQHPAADSAYILGTTRMGADQASSVVDADLRCHDHENLYLVGGSVFPTAGSAPPTLTIAALALRLADHLSC